MDKDNILRAAVEAAEQMDNNQPQGMGVPPQPVPTAVQLSSSKDNNGNKFVVMAFMTPVGQSVYFLDPDSAERIADGLKDTALLSRSGLEIAR